MRIVEYQVEPAADGATVERFLRRRGVSRRVLIDLKNDPDGLTVGGAHIRAIDRLHAGDTLRLSLRETERSDTIPQAALPLPIVYEDEDLFVIDKPAGMAVHPSPQNRENTVANALAFRYAEAGEPFVFRAIGRLDKNTSGLLGDRQKRARGMHFNRGGGKKAVIPRISGRLHRETACVRHDRRAHRPGGRLGHCA